MESPFDENFFQWCALALLLVLSFSSLLLAMQSGRLSRDVHEMNGKVDLVSGTYADIFKVMHERLTGALEFDKEA